MNHFTAYRVTVDDPYQRVDGRDSSEISNSSTSHMGLDVSVVGSHRIRIARAHPSRPWTAKGPQRRRGVPRLVGSTPHFGHRDALVEGAVAVTVEPQLRSLLCLLPTLVDKGELATRGIGNGLGPECG